MSKSPTKSEDHQEPKDVPATTSCEHVPLGVTKLEGRQESGRDEQDEAEEDEASAKGTGHATPFFAWDLALIRPIADESRHSVCCPHPPTPPERPAPPHSYGEKRPMKM